MLCHLTLTQDNNWLLGFRLFLPIGNTEVNILSLPTGLGAGDDVH